MSFPGSTTIGAELDPHWRSLWFSHALDRRNGVGLSLQQLPHDQSEGHAGGSEHQGSETFVLLEWTHRLQRWNLPGAQANLWLFAGLGGYHGPGAAAERQSQDHHSDHSATPRQPPDPSSPHHSSPHPSGAAPVHTAGTDLDDGRGGPIRPGVLPVLDGDGRHHDAGRSAASLQLAASPGLQVDIETTRLRWEGRGRLLLAPGVQRSLLSTTAGVALTPARYHGIQPWLELQLRAMPGLIDGVEWIPKLRLLHRHLVLELGCSSRGTLLGGFTFTL